MKIGELTIEEKYQLAEKYRTDGNIYFKVMAWPVPCSTRASALWRCVQAKCYEAAIKKYSETKTFINHCIPKDVRNIFPVRKQYI